MAWILLTYQLPSEPSRARVAVWREVRRSGALHLQQSVLAFPDTPEFRSEVERFQTVVADVGGDTLTIGGEPLTGADGDRLVERWNAARNAEYDELVSECEKLLAEIDHELEIEKLTDAELEEEEAELGKLQRWHERIRRRDVHQAPTGREAAAAIERAQAALARFANAVFERTAP
jgi:hypothetical protein